MASSLRRGVCTLLSLALLVGAGAPALAEGPVLCGECSKEIVGRYWIDPWGNKVHEAHNLPHCYFCDRQIGQHLTGGGVRMGDGRTVCNLCRQEAVASEEEGRRIVQEERDRMSAWGLGVPMSDVKVSLVDTPQMRSLWSKDHVRDQAQRLGLTHTRMLRRGAEVVSVNHHIYLLSGMPRSIFRGVAAHELMHAWRGSQGIEARGPVLEEGSAELMAYYALKSSPSALSDYAVKRMLKNPDPVYGAGFRRVVQYVRDHELSGLMQLIRTQRELPAGY